ncbi:energy transducer TonB [Luteimonas huabeiensis]|uniref:energy transducer TonB n=1 Tax=Luteimonas huabeiensis TaxID=1244513 RepID=UPI000466E109|nr:energy transducer TonB [Luteimonas huabeiensis]
MSMWRRRAGAALLGTIVGLGGCDRADPPAPALPEGSGAADAAGRAGAIGPAAEVEALRRRAQAALQARRLHAPAGDNAAEHFLALRARAPADAAAREALLGLQPYVLIAAEQALARADADEAARLAALLARIDPAAPALPRLRGALAALDAAPAAPADPGRDVALSPAGAADAPAVPAPDRSSAAMPARDVAASVPALPSPAAPVPEPGPGPVVAAPEAPAPRADARAASAPPASARPPALVQDAAPRYPTVALNRRLEGQVVLAFSIGPDGRVAQARVVSAEPAGVFDRAALAAAAQWRFEATGRIHATTRTLRFSLDEAGASAAGG